MQWGKYWYVIRRSLWVLAVGGAIPLWAAPGPPIRTGLWVTQKVSGDRAELEVFANSIRANHQLTGVCLHVPWNEIEKEPGKFDFRGVDSFVTVLRNIGMKYQLCLKPGASTPGFVYAGGAQSFQTRVTNPHRANVGQPITIPVPWDPVYQRNFSQAVAQLGERYARDPLCVSVVLTCANFLSAEMHLPKRGEDLEKWKALGNYEEKLLGVYKKYTDEWAKAFPRQEISLHVSKVLDLPPQFCEQVIDYGLNKYPERFSIQNCQLTGRREDTGMMTYDLILKYRDRAHHGFQSLASLSRGGPRMGSIELAVLNVIHGEGEYWELWRGDGLSLETSSAIAKAWEEGRRLGYDAYKNKLMSEGKYRTRDEDDYRARPRGRRHST
ncbi:MAG TPA: beta-galactosidase [Candidatus Udaeobacter sp.]|nr:beta-galactosidase [Candidatus Udaeobacter sp.]